MASVNKVILVGNLGKDPETKTFENGGMVCSFSLATTESYWDKEKNQRVERPTEWHNIRIGQSGLAKVAQQYLRKGSQVYIEGSLRTRSYQTKEGETRYITEVNVVDMVLTGGKPGGGATESGNQSTHETPPVNYSPAEGDDLPF
jgi:single-strand DNA-binding protein